MKLRVEHLQKSFQDADRNLTVIADLSFEFPESGSVGIIGRSGIGKSTLLYLLGGLEQPSSGAVWFDDLNLCALSSDALAALRGESVGFVFQAHKLLGEFSALENVAMPLIISGVAESSALSRSAKMLERVGLAERATHRPGQLSGGEQQRVAIARALIARPKLVLADEPTGNLDPQSAAVVQGLLVDLQRELNGLLIMVTHSRELATALDYQLEMQAGGALERL